MAGYLGDFVTGDVVYIEVCFVDGNGSPTAVSGGSACIKRMGSSSLLNSGVGAITTSGGLCTLAIFTGSASSLYTKGDYSVFMGAGTVTGTSVIGYTLAQFSIGRTTAITYSSNVLQWNGSAVSNAASGIPKVDIDTIKTNAVVNGGTFTFPTNATGASTTNITAGTITTVTNLTNAPTSGDFTSTMKTSIQTAVTTVTLSADVLKWNGTAVSSPATAGIPDVNVKNWGNTTAALATVSANVVTVTGTAIENAVWDATLASHLNAGSTGEGLNSASSAGDPWNTALPGAYTAGKAGYLLGNLMDHTTLTVSANTLQWNGTTPNNLISGRVDANAAAVTVSADVLNWNGTAVSTPATAGIPEVNVKNINNVSTSAVTTVKAVQGLTTADQVTTAVNLTTNNDKTGYALSSAGNNAAADAFLLRDIATGASATDRNVQNALRAIRNKTALTGSTLTVFQEDDTSTAWTAVTTTTTAMSITSVDPA